MSQPSSRQAVHKWAVECIEFLRQIAFLRNLNDESYLRNLDDEDSTDRYTPERLDELIEDVLLGLRAAVEEGRQAYKGAGRDKVFERAPVPPIWGVTGNNPYEVIFDLAEKWVNIATQRVGQFDKEQADEDLLERERQSPESLYGRLLYPETNALEPMFTLSDLDFLESAVESLQEKPSETDDPGTVKFTCTEAADYVGVHESTIRRWIRNRRIKAESVGGTTYYQFQQSELDAHKTAQEAKKAKSKAKS